MNNITCHLVGVGQVTIKGVYIDKIETRGRLVDMSPRPDDLRRFVEWKDWTHIHLKTGSILCIDPDSISVECG
jgi:hypothetical protein